MRLLLLGFFLLSKRVKLSCPTTLSYCTTGVSTSSVKANSSKWINEHKFLPEKFNWQTGGAVFSVDYRKVDIVKRYIANQKVHHSKKKNGFKKEFVKFLDSYDVDYDIDDIEQFFI